MHDPASPVCRSGCRTSGRKPCLTIGIAERVRPSFRPIALGSGPSATTLEGVDQPEIEGVPAVDEREIDVLARSFQLRQGAVGGFLDQPGEVAVPGAQHIFQPDPCQLGPCCCGSIMKCSVPSRTRSASQMNSAETP